MQKKKNSYKDGYAAGFRNKPDNGHPGYTQGRLDRAILEDRYIQGAAVGPAVIAQRIQNHVRRTGTCYLYMSDNYSILLRTKERSSMDKYIVGMYSIGAKAVDIFDDLEQYLLEMNYVGQV